MALDSATHYVGRSRRGRFVVDRQTQAKRAGKKLKALGEKYVGWVGAQRKPSLSHAIQASQMCFSMALTKAVHIPKAACAKGAWNTAVDGPGFRYTSTHPTYWGAKGVELSHMAGE
jgi:hypothetical protein